MRPKRNNNGSYYFLQYSFPFCVFTGGTGGGGGGGGGDGSGLLGPLGEKEVIIAVVCSSAAAIFLIAITIVVCCCLYYKVCKTSKLENIEAHGIIADGDDIAVKLKKTKGEQERKSKLKKETSNTIPQQPANSKSKVATDKSSEKQNKIKPVNEEDTTKNITNGNGTPNTSTKKTDTQNSAIRSTSVGSGRKPAPQRPPSKSGVGTGKTQQPSGNGTKPLNRSQRPPPSQPGSKLKKGSSEHQPTKSLLPVDSSKNRASSAGGKNKSSNSTSVTVNPKKGVVAYKKK